MTTIAGKNDLPDCSDVRPLVRAEDLTGLNQAIEQFESRLAAFNAAVNDAEQTVNLTLAWIGVGEKLLNLADAALQRRTADSGHVSQASTGQSVTSGLVNRLGGLSSLCDSLAKALLPALA